ARSPRDPALRTEHAALLLERAQRSQLPTDVEAALAALEDLVADDPVNATHRLRLGIAHALDGDLDAARHQLELAADLAPRSTAPPLNLAELHLRRGDADAATAALDRAAAIDPDDPRVAALRQQITEGTR